MIWAAVCGLLMAQAADPPATESEPAGPWLMLEFEASFILPVQTLDATIDLTWMQSLIDFQPATARFLAQRDADDVIAQLAAIQELSAHLAEEDPVTAYFFLRRAMAVLQWVRGQAPDLIGGQQWDLLWQSLHRLSKQTFPARNSLLMLTQGSSYDPTEPRVTVSDTPRQFWISVGAPVLIDRIDALFEGFQLWERDAFLTDTISALPAAWLQADQVQTGFLFANIERDIESALRAVLLLERLVRGRFAEMGEEGPSYADYTLAAAITDLFNVLNYGWAQPNMLSQVDQAFQSLLNEANAVYNAGNTRYAMDQQLKRDQDILLNPADPPTPTEQVGKSHWASVHSELDVFPTKFDRYSNQGGMSLLSIFTSYDFNWLFGQVTYDAFNDDRDDAFVPSFEIAYQLSLNRNAGTQVIRLEALSFRASGGLVYFNLNMIHFSVSGDFQEDPAIYVSIVPFMPTIGFSLGPLFLYGRAMLKSNLINGFIEFRDDPERSFVIKGLAVDYEAGFSLRLGIDHVHLVGRTSLQWLDNGVSLVQHRAGLRGKIFFSPPASREGYFALGVSAMLIRENWYGPGGYDDLRLELALSAQLLSYHRQY